MQIQSQTNRPTTGAQPNPTHTSTYRSPDRPPRREQETGSTLSKPASGTLQRMWGKVSKGSRGTAYIQTWSKVPEAGCQYLDGLLAEYNDDTTHFFKHVFSCSRLPTYYSDWVPVPWTVRHAKLRKSDPQALVDAGLLETKPHDRARGKCQEWRVADGIQMGYNRHTKHAYRGPYVNLFDRKRTQKKAKSRLNDENGNPLPSLIRKALVVIPYGFFNADAVNEHLDRLEAAVISAEVAVEDALTEHGEGTSEYDRALVALRKERARYNNDDRCREVLWGERLEEVGDGIYRFKIGYDKQTSGRLTHQGGGAQSCSREMKVALYEGLDDVHNYDIRSSQAYILADYLAEAGLDTTWIDTYLSTKEAKYVYAEKAGVSVDTWKGIFYALLMGATLPQDINRSKGDVKVMLKEEAGDDLREVFERVCCVLSPLYELVQRWHKWLADVWLKDRAYAGRGGWYVKNDTGSILNVSELTERPDHKVRSQLAAFLLQGREAAFIHTLTVLSKKYGYKVIANEHDGLVTIGEIPQEAIDLVREERSMSYVQIVEKAFV